MLLYYITDRRQFPGDEQRRRERLLEKIAEAARAGVELIQLREKDLPARDLEQLARAAMGKIARETQNSKSDTRLLINSRTDVVLPTGASGVHLTSNDISAADAHVVADLTARNSRREARNMLVGVSCHSLAEVRLAESQGADFAVFGPVFEKSGITAVNGLEALRRACQRVIASDTKTESGPPGRMPVLALGGVTLENAAACIEAGAAGIAAIRLFQENDISEIVRALRAMPARAAGGPANAGSSSPGSG